MNKMIFARSSLAPVVAAGLALLQLAGAGSALAAANCIKGEHKAPFKIGWANIYSIPTWMKETTGTIEDMANVLKKQGLVDSLTITDAQGNANTQIQQIQSMIDAKLDAIIVDAGSATALDRVIADACSKGIAVTNFDSLVDTKDLTTKIDTDQAEWGKLAAEWLVKQLNGKGNILVLNGPAGVSVSDDRRKGAEPVFKANPGIKISGGDQHALQRRARAGSRHQPALQQSSDRRGLEPGRGALGGSGDRVREAGAQARSDHRRELSAIPRDVEAEEAHRLGDAAAELARGLRRLCGR